MRCEVRGEDSMVEMRRVYDVEILDCRTCSHTKWDVLGTRTISFLEQADRSVSFTRDIGR